jgi:RNA polymerase sigma factor (sigma-70 family)
MDKRLPPSVIAGLKNGDATSFSIVYANYRALLFFIIVSIVKDEEDAKDILQDTFVKILENVSTLRDNGKFHGWVSGIAKNMALNHLKAKHQTLELSDPLLDVIGREDEHFHFLQDWNAGLSDTENTIIAYKIVYDFTFQEIARQLHTPLSSVYKIYREALGKLKKSYPKETRK